MNRYYLFLLILLYPILKGYGQDPYFYSNFQNQDRGIEFAEIFCASWDNIININIDSLDIMKSNPKIIYIKLRNFEKVSRYFWEFTLPEKDTNQIKFDSKIIMKIHWWNKNVDTFEFGDIKKRTFKLNKEYYKFDDLLFKYVLEYIPSYNKLQFELYEH